MPALVFRQCAIKHNYFMLAVQKLIQWFDEATYTTYARQSQR